MSPLVFQPVLAITRVKLVSYWLVTMNHCIQETQQHEAAHAEQADDESRAEFQVRCWHHQLAILLEIKMAWELQFFVLGCLAVVTCESHHHAGYFLNKYWILIIKGVKMSFFKCYPHFLSYKFDMCNGYEDVILFIDALFLKSFQETQKSSTDEVQVEEATAGPSGLQVRS